MGGANLMPRHAVAFGVRQFWADRVVGEEPELLAACPGVRQWVRVRVRVRDSDFVCVCMRVRERARVALPYR